MYRNKLIALVVGGALVLGAGAAFGESESESDEVTQQDAVDACEMGQGDVSFTQDENFDVQTVDCDLGEGYGYTFDAESGIVWEWTESKTPPSDSDPTPGDEGAGHASKGVVVEAQPGDRTALDDGESSEEEADPSGDPEQGTGDDDVAPADEADEADGTHAAEEAEGADEAVDEDDEGDDADDGSPEGSGSYDGARSVSRSPGQKAR